MWTEIEQLPPPPLAPAAKPWPSPERSTGLTAFIPMPDTGYFHLHLVSDATGETLITVARAAAAQYANVSPVEHLYPMVRSKKQLDQVLAEIAESPGIVLYTLLEEDLIEALEKKCRELGLPCLSILGPILRLFQSYLGAETMHRVGAQHMLNAEYFKRIDALNYTMLHDDGQHVDGLEEADVVLVGVSRTSKTPTSIYLANRGVKTGNVPLVPGVPLPPQVEALTRPLVVGPVRQPRAHRADPREPAARPAKRITTTTNISTRRRWRRRSRFRASCAPSTTGRSIDVTRRSIEETAAAVLRLLTERRRARRRA